MIKASAHSDDYLHEIEFDAEPYFKAARDSQLLALIACGFGGDYPADEVAQLMAEEHPELEKMLDYVEHTQDSYNPQGFECYVDIEDARQWIKNNRPSLVPALEAV